MYIATITKYWRPGEFSQPFLSYYGGDLQDIVIMKGDHLHSKKEMANLDK